jgi:hypothetical protein
LFRKAQNGKAVHLVAVFQPRKKGTIVKKLFAFVIAGAFLLLCANPIPAQDNQAKKIAEGKKILKKWIAAQGGRGTLLKIKDSTITGNLSLVTMNINGSFAFQHKNPGKFRQEYKILGMKIIQAFNGTKGWMTNQQTGAVEDVPAMLLDELKRSAFEDDAMLNPDKHGVVFTFEGPKTEDGKEYIILKQTYRDGYAQTHYLDSRTYLEYKSVAMVLDETGTTRVERETAMSDYRDVQGMKCPFSITLNQRGAKFADLTDIQFKFNANIEDSFFDKP